MPDFLSSNDGQINRGESIIEACKNTGLKG